MHCTYCFDSCCQYGVDVDGTDRRAPRGGRTPSSRRSRGVPRPLVHRRVDRRPRSSRAAARPARASRTAPASSATARAAAASSTRSPSRRGIDYHELKPMVSTSFPLTFDYGLLHPSNEIEDRSLQCYGDGPTLYRGRTGRDRAGTSGRSLVAELDASTPWKASGAGTCGDPPPQSRLRGPLPKDIPHGPRHRRRLPRARGQPFRPGRPGLPARPPAHEGRGAARQSKNKAAVTALREIAAGKVHYDRPSHDAVEEYIEELNKREFGAELTGTSARDRELEAGSLAHYEDPAYYTATYARRIEDVAFYVGLAQRVGRAGARVRRGQRAHRAAHRAPRDRGRRGRPLGADAARPARSA